MDNEQQQLNYYRMDADKVLGQLNSQKTGLTSTEARDRLHEFGRNELEHAHRELVVIAFIKQFKNFLIILLLISAGLALYLRDNKTATILLAICLINASIGFFQEHKAESLMESLEKLVVPKAKVMRDGTLEEVDSTELVLGDVVYVEEGDSVPADIRLFDEEELATNDFALTGESNPTRKFVHAIQGEVPLANRHNLLFMGTTVAIGHGHGVVVGAGMHSELGRIASLSQTTSTDKSPLQKEMNHLARSLTLITIILAMFLAVIALKANLSLRDSILFGIGIAAAMIPNGLAAEVSITLAQAAARMARSKALVKKLSAVETLGATTVIATDKTGTLTKNEMTVEHLLIGKSHYETTGTGYEANGQITTDKGKTLTAKQLSDLELFFVTGILASNAHVDPPDAEHPDWYVIGDPTEGALITLARKAGLDPDKITANNRELREFAFDSARKRMSSIRLRNKQTVLFVKGAPESVLQRSHEMWDHGHIRPLTTKDRTFFADYNDSRAHEAMRNLAFAYRILPANVNPKKMKIDEAEQDLTFLGTVSILDPLREEVPAAMKAAHLAHVKVSIVTGDFPTTAAAIARQAGLAPEGTAITVVLGEDLPKLADSQIVQLLAKGGVVFSRTTPEDKLHLVDLAKQHGQVVAVTGDGINDAPALKRADIGVAMGRTGTDVAKQAAAIVLLDDSFNTLIGAVEEGRLTFENIKKAARCALTADAGELFIVLFGLGGTVFFHIPIAITAIQVLAIDVIAQIFPISALGWDSAERQLMHEKPRDLKKHIINWESAKEFYGYGLLAAVLAYVNFLWFFWRQNLSPEHVSHASPLYASATILTYLTIVLCQFVNLLFVRSSHSKKFFTHYLWDNKRLLIAFCFSFFCILNMIYNPWIRPYFSAGPLTLSDWSWAVLAALIYLLVNLLNRHTSKHSRKAVLELHRKKSARQLQTSS